MAGRACHHCGGVFDDAGALVCPHCGADADFTHGGTPAELDMDDDAYAEFLREEGLAAGETGRRRAGCAGLLLGLAAVVALLA